MELRVSLRLANSFSSSFKVPPPRALFVCLSQARGRCDYIVRFLNADRQRSRTDHVAVQSDRVLREHQTAADVHAPVLVRRQHDRRQKPGPVLRGRAPQADQVRRGRTEPRRLLHPPRRAGYLHAAVFRGGARFPAERGGQLRLVHRQRRSMFRRRYVPVTFYY